MENVLRECTRGLMNGVPPCLAPDVRGFTSPKVRTLLNSLVKRLPSDEAYLEIGPHVGATLISALLDNKSATAYACDNFSRFDGAKRAEKCLLRNLARYKERLPEVAFFRKDSWDLAKEDAPFSKPIGIYFYDGCHTEDCHFRAITEFSRFLAPRSIFLVDDWNWEHVREETARGLKASNPRKVEFHHLPSRGNCDLEGFWNGIGAFYIER